MPSVSQDDFLSIKLGPAIYIDWERFVRLDVPLLPAVEYFTAGKKQERNIVRQLRQISSRVDIGTSSPFRILLAVFGPADRGAVNDKVGFVCLKLEVDSRSVGNVKLIAREPLHVPRRRPAWSRVNEVLSD